MRTMIVRWSNEPTRAPRSPFFFLLLLVTTVFFTSGGAQDSEPVAFDIHNKCPFPIWPATAANTGHTVVADGGFLLLPGSSREIQVPPSWNGRLWARTGCDFESAENPGCQTGDCEGVLECRTPGLPPATILEVSLQAEIGEPSYYDVSLLDGYNLPVSVASRPSQQECFIGGCRRNPNKECPLDLQVLADEASGAESGTVVACKSACLAYNQDEYCCREGYSTPETCLPSSFSTAFKEACPFYLTYAFDIPTSLHKCDTKAFVVTFCPSGRPAATDHIQELTESY